MSSQDKSIYYRTILLRAITPKEYSENIAKKIINHIGNLEESEKDGTAKEIIDMIQSEMTEAEILEKLKAL